MLYFVGIGPTLEDVSVEARKVIRECDIVFLESYTNFLGIKKEDIEEFLGVTIEEIERSNIEDEMGKIIEVAKRKKVCIITFGNPLFATTHFYYFIEGRRRGVDVKFIHCPSVFDLVLETGLHPYKFGKIASISFHYSETPYDVLKQNLSINSHTLFLLDLDPRNKRFISIKDSIMRLIEIEEKRGEGIFSEKNMMLGCARLGTDRRKIVYASAEELMEVDFGDPPYCLIHPAKKLHFTEEEALEFWRIP